MLGGIQQLPGEDETDKRDALVVLLHLLSPAWYRAQVRPELPQSFIHIVGQHQPRTSPGNVVGKGVIEPLLSVEGNIFGA